MNLVTIGLTVVELIGMAGTLFAVVIGVWAADEGERRATRLIGIALAVWQALVLTLAAQGFFLPVAGDKAPRIALAILPLTLAALLTTSVPTVRAVLSRIPAHQLVAAQGFRVVGVVLLTGTLFGLFPPQFGLPAGIGDLLVGLFAPSVAKNLERGVPGSIHAAKVWNAMGVLDLVIALSMGVMTSPGPLQLFALGHPNLGITRFPFVLIPMLLVQIALILHGLTVRALAHAGEHGDNPVALRQAL